MGLYELTCFPKLKSRFLEELEEMSENEFREECKQFVALSVSISSFELLIMF